MRNIQSAVFVAILLAGLSQDVFAAVQVNPGPVGTVVSTPGAISPGAFMSAADWSGNTVTFEFSDSKHVEFSPGTYRINFLYANVVSTNTNVNGVLLDESGNSIASTAFTGIVGSNTYSFSDFSVSTTLVAHGVSFTFATGASLSKSQPGNLGIVAPISAGPSGKFTVGKSESLNVAANTDPPPAAFNGYDPNLPVAGGALVDLPTVNSNETLLVRYDVLNASSITPPGGYSVGGTKLQTWNVNFNNDAFNGLATLSFMYDESLLGAIPENQLKILHKFSDNSGIEILDPLSIDTVKNIITVEVDRFSSFGLIAANGPTAAVVPEPASLAMWSVGLLGCAVSTYRRRTAVTAGPREANGTKRVSLV